jgi:hypothetical protein
MKSRRWYAKIMYRKYAAATTATTTTARNKHRRVDEESRTRIIKRTEGQQCEGQAK